MKDSTTWLPKKKKKLKRCVKKLERRKREKKRRSRNKQQSPRMAPITKLGSIKQNDKIQCINVLRTQDRLEHYIACRIQEEYYILVKQVIKSKPKHHVCILK